MGDNIKVIDAEPQQQATASPSQQGGINANALLNNTLDGFANLSSKFNPFAQRLGKGIGQVRQVRYQYVMQGHVDSCMPRIVCTRAFGYSRRHYRTSSRV